jgi:uncharacterized membrane-anchored protein
MATAKNPHSHPAWQTLTKVPQITAFFWVIKILTTGMGEASSDALVNKLGPAIAVPLALIALLVALKAQFSARAYVPGTYWMTVVMVAIFGTMAADGVHLLGVPYIASTIFYAVVLAVVFRYWHKSEGTLSIHSVHTRQRETFYWLTVLATFALGTAAGDMTAASLNLGYLTSGILFAVAFAIPAIGYWRFKWNPIFTFWFAYIITRPLGASFADWIGKPKPQGLGLGDGTISLILFGIIVVLVGYLQITHEDAPAKRYKA